jgi:hypothetical protein
MAKDESSQPVALAQLEEDPRTALRLIVVPEKFAEFFPALVDKVMHWFGWGLHYQLDIHKAPAKDPPRRVIWINSSHMIVMLDKPQADIQDTKRFIEVASLTLVLVGKKGKLGFRCDNLDRSQPGTDLLVKLESEKAVHQVIRVLQLIYFFRTGGGDLNVLQSTTESGDLFDEMELYRENDWVPKLSSFPKRKDLWEYLRTPTGQGK